jgi:hypothetical protein
MPEIADTFGRVIGRKISYYQVPWDQFEEQMGEEYALSCTGGSTTWATKRTSLPCGKSTPSLLPSSGTSAATDGRARSFLREGKLCRAIIIFGVGIVETCVK